MFLLPEAVKNTKRNLHSSFFWHANELIGWLKDCHGFDLMSLLAANARA